jgi:predicted ATPase
MARHVGWAESELTKVVAVAFRESRCQPDAFNKADTVGQSYGAMQINDFWCLPSKYWPNGYMQAYGLLTVCDDLFDLETNLRAALNIWRYSNGWSAWSQ